MDVSFRGGKLYAFSYHRKKNLTPKPTAVLIEERLQNLEQSLGYSTKPQKIATVTELRPKPKFEHSKPKSKLGKFVSSVISSSIEFLKWYF